MTKISLALTTVAAALVLAACGGSSSSSSTSAPPASTPAATASPTSSSTSSTPPAASPSSALQLAADPSGALKFTTSSLSAKAGKVTIAFANSAPLTHNLTISSAGGKVVAATPTFQGGTKSLALNLKPGTYTFYCSVPGHRQAGMQGNLVVH